MIKNQNHLNIGSQFSNGHGLSHGHGLNQRVGHWVSNEVGFVGSHGVGIDHGVGDRVGHVGVHGVSHGIGQKDRVGLIILILIINIITTSNRNCPLPDTIEQGEAFSREGGGLAFCRTRLVILLLVLLQRRQ